MIIHSYLTDGLFGWAELFVESFYEHHGSEHMIYLCTRDLNRNQIEKLKSLYPNIIVSNKKINFDSISKRARMSKDKILELKKHIETNAVTKDTFIWKQAISVEDRYRTSIVESMDKYPNEDYLVHFDIDMYFRNPLDDLFEIIRNNDISIKFRLNGKDNRKVMGGLIGFRICKETRKFMNRWIYYIDKIPLYKKPIGYGQTSFYYAYRDLEKDYNWGQVRSKYISPRFEENDFIWSGNTKSGKVINLKRCRDDFNKRRKNNVNKELC